MIPVKIDASDLEHLGTELRTYPDRARPVFAAGVEAAADVVVREAKRTRAFRDRTGNLRRGITQIKDQSNPLTRIVTVLGPAAAYADAVENRSPFLHPAARHTLQQQVRAFERAITGRLPE